jgi:hypothetical protein
LSPEPTIDLTDAELVAVATAIRRAIETDRFPRAPRLDPLRRNHPEAQVRERKLQDGKQSAISPPPSSARRRYMVANAQAALHFLDRPDVDEVREALSCIVRDGARAAALVDRASDLCPKTAPPDRTEFLAAARSNGA